MEYIIQLDPQICWRYRTGEPIQSNIPPSAGKIHSYRIVVGTQKLPRDMPPVDKIRLNRRSQSFPMRKGLRLRCRTPCRPTPAESSSPRSRPFSCNRKTPPRPISPSGTAPTEDETGKPAKPWLPLTFTVLGLVASLSANMYLGWIVVDLRRRWRMIQRRETLIKTDRR